MSPRPLIFISAVSRELRSARQLVANTLTFLGYEAVWQDIFGTESGDLCEVLRRRIDQCKGVVQLVGKSYGAEPAASDEQFGRVSYTQYEALYARQRGKKVWYLFIDESFPVDADGDEPAEITELQAAYRRRVKSDAHLFHALTNREALEAGVLKLRDDLTTLRRGVKQWAAGVAILLLIIAGSVLWLVRGQKQATQKMDETAQAMSTVASEMSKLRQGLLEYPQVETKVRQTETGKNPAREQERIYAALSKQLGLSVNVLKETMPRLLENWKHSAGATDLEKATAAFIAKDYPEAERLALQAAGKSSAGKRAESVRAFQLAGLSAQRNLQYDRALQHSAKRRN
ncbi:MAG: hypothetical protein DLM73_06280 [Chthoniobacterales bacterium]|nr:MAG: hypothetical protein DLM73_06280 [Chthoniobacterales bacterium]